MAFSPYGRAVWQRQGTLQGAGITSTGPIDVRDATDLWLEAYVAGTPTGTTPTLTVQLDGLDAFGNVFPALLTLTALTPIVLRAQGSAGVHVPAPGSLVLPAACQVTWTLAGTNPVFPSVSLTLTGR